MNSDSITAERMFIGGPVRWVVTDAGRIIVQFATQSERSVAVGLYECGYRIVRYDQESTQIELERVE